MSMLPNNNNNKKVNKLKSRTRKIKVVTKEPKNYYWFKLVKNQIISIEYQIPPYST